MPSLLAVDSIRQESTRYQFCDNIGEIERFFDCLGVVSSANILNMFLQ